MNAKKILQSDALFLKGRSRMIPDWYLLFEHLFTEGKITKEDAKRIILTASKFFSCLIRKRTESPVLTRPGYHSR